MPAHSAGLLPYRVRDGRIEVFLVHPGGPFWAKKDDGAWSIAKGEFVEGTESGLDAAVREFREETGQAIHGPFHEFPVVRQRSGKIVHAWAVRADVDAQAIASNTFSMEWPPKSGRFRDFPEIDRAAWFDLDTARAKLVEGQRPLLDHLAAHVG
ncbi:MAG TPA: NUDIX domain-containing protein [Nevskiaceae bacterium]|nr:NUDIX domain-containing protein [Nevskiaceae bacterium]